MKIRLISYLIFSILITSISSTKLILSSTQSSSTSQPEPVQIPQMHEHPFSCQLVFFNVYRNIFTVNITQINKNVTNIQLDITMRSQLIYSNSTNVINGTVCFNLQLVPQSQSYQVIMDFNVSYQVSIQDQQTGQILNSQYNQVRKAYMLFCQKGQNSYLVRLPFGTIAITQAIGLILILTLPWNVQYRKFLPFSFNIFTCFLYIVVLVIALYLQMIFGTISIVYDIQKYFVGIFQLVCLVMYSQDLLMLVCQKNRIAFLFGFIFGVTVIGLDYFAPGVRDAWFLNDLIAIMVAGAFIKFVIIRKVKTAIWAIALFWIFCVFRQFAKQFGLQKFDQGLGIRVVPLFLQLPTFIQGDKSSISCSAFGSSKIIAFGVILNYCKRIDLYLSTQFYRIMASSLAVVCIGCQLVFNLVFDELPTIQVMSIILYYPISVALLIFFANKRGEWAEVWHGSFYDMAVNRASIPRSVSFDGISQGFGKDLMINSRQSESSRQ